ncbi:MSP domain protein [Ancylostoma ceylanicum]|uniref:Major sperm protein n=1 Tax=Ancylostoma ceylanicum TaxID=53326 RepID=A0A0D6LG69_9BILA|nr:MSP domain protein [Ancylostoma ceylanicum]
METDDFYKLREGMDNSLDPLVNIHEMIFRPLDKLVFNAPFDFDNITYHMTILNNTKHPIAFAIKGNCIPRVIAYPPYGILKSKQKIPVAVTMRRRYMEALKCFEDIPHLCIRASVILRYYPVLWDKELKFNLEAVQNDQGTCGFKAFLRASESVDEGAKHTV